MARQIRIEYAGAVYHVRARGNQGQPVFADDLDQKLWLQTLGEACEKTGGRIYTERCAQYPFAGTDHSPPGLRCRSANF
jgi:hypothetical protein